MHRRSTRCSPCAPTTSALRPAEDGARRCDRHRLERGCTRRGQGAHPRPHHLIASARRALCGLSRVRFVKGAFTAWKPIGAAQYGRSVGLQAVKQSHRPLRSHPHHLEHRLSDAPSSLRLLRLALRPTAPGGRRHARTAGPGRPLKWSKRTESDEARSVGRALSRTKRAQSDESVGAASRVMISATRAGFGAGTPSGVLDVHLSPGWSPARPPASRRPTGASPPARTRLPTRTGVRKRTLLDP